MTCTKRGRCEEEERWRVWELLLPWLPPRDIASVSSACTSLRRLSAAVSARRASDASRGLERRPIPFRGHPRSSSSSSSPPPPYSCFLYTPHPVAARRSLPPDPFSLPWGGETEKPTPASPSPFAAFVDYGGSGGCDCGEGQDEEGCCRLPGEGCPCGFLSPDFRGAEEGAAGGVMTECGPGCRCGAGCGNRRTQGRLEVGVEIAWDERKGWGLRASQLIQKGEFVCEYAGEFLTTEEARRRQRMYDELATSGQFAPALLVVREHLPSGKACLRINIDATMIGNVARFINHSCDGGNLLSILVRNSGSPLPRLCFFAARHIQEGEELTFSYGETRVKPKGRPCFCRSPCCQGTLPSEET
ncbi:hypothetical protein Taro_038039 [Colocasia esculenta]|uniref:SET domain-containing protein n=1 Tax=Colocasia esculenta TaxID=4460 RepID=A0A843WI12_COLES|nr:hypothetical protein [Colocasia esculenta]